MPTNQSEQSDIIRSIATAFDGVRLGSGIGLHRTRNIDDFWYDDVSLSDKDPEISWTELTDEKLRTFSDVFVFLDPEGFRFYLPAFMGWVLRNADDGLDWSFCFALCGHDEPSEPPYRLQERVKLLTLLQVRAVHRFIEYQAGGGWASEVSVACLSFWNALGKN